MPILVKILLLLLAVLNLQALDKPNIIVYFADDISAREIPVYGSSVWSDNLKGYNSTDPKFRAETPVLNKLANEGVWITNAWAATICPPPAAARPG